MSRARNRTKIALRGAQGQEMALGFDDGSAGMGAESGDRGMIDVERMLLQDQIEERNRRSDALHAMKPPPKNLALLSVLNASERREYEQRLREYDESLKPGF